MHLVTKEAIKSPILKDIQQQISISDDYEKITIPFWRKMAKEHTPLIEKLEEEPNHYLVTFIFQYSGKTKDIFVDCSAFGKFFERKQMVHLNHSDIYYNSVFVRNQTRISYEFLFGDIKTPLYLEDSSKVRENISKAICDPLNNKKLKTGKDHYISYLETPDCLKQKWYELEDLGDSTEKGCVEDWFIPIKSQTKEIDKEKKAENKNTKDSEDLKEIIEQPVQVYLPPGYKKEGHSYPVGIFFDGAWLMSHDYFHTEHVFNKLILKEAIPPMIFVLIYHLNRDKELCGNSEFQEFVVRELIPQLQNKYPVTKDPKKTVIGGMSFGGLTAMDLALHNPHIFGKVISQSGSFWVGKNEFRQYEDPTSQYLISEVVKMPKVDLDIFMEIGFYETPESLFQMANHYFSNLHMRDLLLAKGYNVKFQEFNGDHNPLQWRESLAEALIFLMGKKN
ncbi:MAG: DUF3327 domain-containing protein [Asgard group archaeon]|nr:DUF3327 domain-containing protein [Asgard group archaeon]